jgi:hypothetical protein
VRRPVGGDGAEVVRTPQAVQDWSADRSRLRPSTGRATGSSLCQGGAQPAPPAQ